MTLTILALTLHFAAQPVTPAVSTFGSTLGLEVLRRTIQETTDTFTNEVAARRAVLELTSVEKIQVSAKFVPTATEVIAQIPTSLTKEQAEKRVRAGFMLFLGNFARFVYQRARVDVIVLKETDFKPYLAEAAKAGRCGEIPCSIPPCCKNCDACPPKAM